MRVSEFCKSYFNVCDIRCNTIGIVQILSYFTVIIPLGLAATYGIAYLYERVTKKQEPSELDRRVGAQLVNNHPHLLLIGNPGVGKTAVAEKLSQHIAQEGIPESLRNEKILRFAKGSLIAETKSRGEAALLAHTNRVNHPRESVKNELLEPQDKMRLLHKLITTINAHTSESGELDCSQQEEIKQLLKQAKEMGVDIQLDKHIYTKEERDGLLENLHLNNEDLKVMNDMHAQSEEPAQVASPKNNMPSVGIPVNTTPLSPTSPAVALSASIEVISLQRNAPAGIPNRIPRFHTLPPLEQLHTIITEEETTLLQTTSNDTDIKVQKAILQRVRAKLEKAKAYSLDEQLERVFYSLWKSATLRPDGRQFLEDLLGKKEYANIMRGITYGFIPPSFCTNYTKIERWVEDDNLIALVSKIKGAPKALPGQSHEDHAQIIRSWLDVPANVEKIQILVLDASLKLTFVPPEIGKLTALNNCLFDGGFFKEFPEEISNLCNLEQFYCTHGSLEEIQPEIYNLPKLKLLNLSYNKIKKLPPDIIHRTNLKVVLKM